MPFQVNKPCSFEQHAVNLNESQHALMFYYIRAELQANHRKHHAA